MAENSFYYDGSLCIACRSCQVACKQWNYLPGEKTCFFAAPGGYQNPADLSSKTWTILKFYEVDEKKQVQWLFRRHHCFHCTDASCIDVCPVEPHKAMTRHPEFGTVYVNQELCIGCGSCVDACPFGVPHLDEEAEKSKKCTSCVDRVANNKLPACAKTCPTHAIRYGEKTEMYALAVDRVEELKAQGFPNANVYGIKQQGGMHSIYVLPERLEIYGLPVNPNKGDLDSIKRRGREKFAAWQIDQGSNLASVAAGPAGAALLAGLAAAGLKKLADRKERVASEETED
ncbi:MAG: 4Fe-4S dicluster domain-containing protein [Candidatus Eisenbacteria bacterium]|uniref:4Fe-4S dicluster domain-containing protein n=1 Tax=Eiseniibacteriota bacterium TaxID=2212470 RepID=A0A948RXR7_UNCEI|nr:4Fe-4S dicluster domain-containing protein [Candidatus Eisenbacteria bacterium]MBU1951253.1 4Fe-4S dicluster domain-containing protein [Candidatus Eisenbacteria bacterium]MBU2691017.1 4Fe-4S dicluster domain-containing protein [Candidatus Eisenbacteria bacterium]